jgi:hypothetical protein
LETEAMMFKATCLGYLVLSAALLSACSSSLRAPDAAQTPISLKPRPTQAGGVGSEAPADSSAPPLAPTSDQLRLLTGLRSEGAAPELFNQVWLNSPPLKLADLRGKAIVIDFWTFG